MSIRVKRTSTLQRHVENDGQQVPVTEEVYHAHKRPAWAERKRKEREKRCVVSNGKGGTKRCADDCHTCKKQRTGSVLSLDKFTDDGFEVSDNFDLTELIADKLLLKELYAALNELDPENRRIMELFSFDKSEREIADDIGLSQKAINKRKTKLFAQLRERLKEFI
ncbi:MAG: RNA polymerase sigma factor [Negativicutes bacterium]